MSCAIAHACLHTCLNLLRCGFYFIPQTDMNSLRQAVFWMPKLPFYVTFSIHSSICLPIHRTAYLRNCTSCDHNFWYTCVKWYLQAFFFFFFFFKKMIFRAVRGGKKTQSKMTKILSLMLPISRTKHHITVIHGTLVWIDAIPGVFFNFSKC